MGASVLICCMHLQAAWATGVCTTSAAQTGMLRDSAAKVGLAVIPGMLLGDNRSRCTRV